jgi:general secretion pathway protein D
LNHHGNKTGALPRLARVALAVVLAGVCFAPLAQAQRRTEQADKRFSDGTELVQLDFRDVELAVVIEAIAKITGKNFIYDDRVRGRVTIVSPTEVTAEQAYAVFESVLKVKGFTAVAGPGGVYKIVPVRDAKESSIETVNDGRPSPNRDQFVTRLVPLRYIDAEAITNTIKPLVSKDASMVAYAPTNTIILTDTESNIRRLLTIFDAIDIRSYKEELAVIKVKYADATTLSEQVSEIYGAEVSSGAAETAAQRRSTRRRSRNQPTPTPTANSTPGSNVRIITDERTNSLLVLAPQSALDDIRELVHQLDVPLQGFGRIHVYYLKHADADELATTLNSMLSGQSSSPTAGRSGAAGANQTQALRSQVTELSEGVTITADAATNALVIQASKEAYETLVSVIERLDIERPQVLVEALILEVDISDGIELGFAMGFQFINGNQEYLVQTGSAVASGAATGSGAASLQNLLNQGGLNAGGRYSGIPRDADGNPTGNGTDLTGVINAAATDSNLNIVSAPHILTSDNEEAEIKIGNNIPIITGRTSNATGNVAGLSQAVNVERQDIGVTLRVTPQISEGDTLRLKIFQELTDVNQNLSIDVGNPEEVGVALFNRKVENTVVVSDGETVVIGGIISDRWTDVENKVPWLGDIPGMGWMFKSTSQQLTKINLLVFLTPHIIRSPTSMEYETIRKRRQFETDSGEQYMTNPDDAAQYDENESSRMSVGRAPARDALRAHAAEYPLSRKADIEEDRRAAAAAIEEARLQQELAERSEYGVRVGIFSDEIMAMETLTQLLDAGYDGNLVSGDVEGTTIYEIVVGPFVDLRAADNAADLLREVYGFDTSVVISKGPEIEDTDGTLP